MFRRTLRRLLSPLIRWVCRYGMIGVAQGRDRTGIFIQIEMPFAAAYYLRLDVAEARDWGRSMLLLARDEVEGVPLPGCPVREDDEP